MAKRKVDLPEPDGPVTASRAPGGTLNCSIASAATAPAPLE